MRALVPAETLVYLESNDLGAALAPIVESKPFTEAAKTRPDLSALKGVQVAVAVTGFQADKEELTEEHWVGRVQPRFVAIIETHAWGWQASAFADQKLGQFVTDIYGADVTQDQIDKNGGKYFTWTANDGRKSFAHVIGSLIYFGNDETAIDKCLTVSRGEADSLGKTGKGSSLDPKALAAGYVSTDGIAQIANIVGLKLASEAGEDPDVQSAIAGLLPQLLRSSITEITWSAARTEQGVEDKYDIAMPQSVANVFVETMAPAANPDLSGLSQLSPDTPVATVYNFKNGEAALASLIQVTKSSVPNADAIAGLLFEPYGVVRPEMFLRATGSALVTVRCDDETGPITLFTYSNFEPVRQALVALDQGVTGTDGGYVELNSKDGEIVAINSTLRPVFLGDKKCVNEAYRGKLHATDSANSLGGRLPALTASIVTLGSDGQTAQAVADVLTESKGSSPARYRSETRFTKSGMERRTVSDLGLIGSIIAQLSGD